MADFIAVVLIAAITIPVYVYFGGFLRDLRNRRAETAFRRASLTFDEADGLYHWKTIAGTLRSSSIHPDAAGGDWYEAEKEARLES